MRKSRVLFSEIKSSLSKSSFSSSILYPYDPNANKFLRFSNSIYTKFVLSQLSNQFPDFKSKDFPDLSIKLYSEMSYAYRKSKKTDLLKYLTSPNVEIIKISHKIGKKMPFEIYEAVKSSALVHARVSSESEENSTMITFAHITMKMIFLNEKGEEKTQLNVFERRFDNKLKDSWRIGFIEELE